MDKVGQDKIQFENSSTKKMWAWGTLMNCSVAYNDEQESHESTWVEVSQNAVVGNAKQNISEHLG